MVMRVGGGSAIEMWRAEGNRRFTDVRLQDRVWAELRSAAVQPGTITVDVNQGVVRLSGAVNTYAEKVTAANVAARVPRIQGVENDIVVAPTPEHALSDASLLRMVASVLRWDSRVPAGRVSASVCDGIVTLTGVVSREEERAATEAAICRLVGVRGVVNHMVVPARQTGPAASSAVRRSIRRSLGRDARGVRVSVRDAGVELYGHVASPAARQAAERAVRVALGDVRLDSRLVIRRQLGLRRS